VGGVAVGGEWEGRVVVLVVAETVKEARQERE
jgi:hypothetical protein